MQAGHEKGQEESGQWQEGMRLGRGYWCPMGDEGRAGHAGAPGTAPGGWTRGSRPQLGAAQCLFPAAGRQDRADIPLQDRVTVRLYSCPLTWRCDPQKAPARPGFSWWAMISKGVMLKNKKDWQVQAERLG